MVALFTMDDKIYIGKSENYDNKGHYDNTDNSLLYVSDCQAAFTFLTSEGCTYPQDEALKQGVYTQEDYKEFSRIEDFLSQAGFSPEKEYYFDDKPFSLHEDTPEQAAPETKTIYYTINEGTARRANDANSFSDYKPGSATAEYRQMVDKVVEIGEQQKKRVDPMYHEKNTVAAMTAALPYMETEIQELAERTAGKLKQLTEEEFARFVFLPAEDME